MIAYELPHFHAHTPKHTHTHKNTHTITNLGVQDADLAVFHGPA